MMMVHRLKLCSSSAGLLLCRQTMKYQLTWRAVPSVLAHLPLHLCCVLLLLLLLFT
jgi:hypothetical protein